jgi:hypothetical protein
MKTDELQLPTACKRHSPAAGATQGYDRLHAKRYKTLNNTLKNKNSI